MTDDLPLPKDPRKSNGGWLAPWRNPMLTRKQQVAVRAGARRVRLPGEMIKGTRFYRGLAAAPEGTHGTGQTKQRTIDRFKRALDAIFAAIARARA